ncbi:MAG: 50S ribosomal protein L22 [Bacilli bacterium]|jgi:large subunit ribosomal protein L22
MAEKEIKKPVAKEVEATKAPAKKAAPKKVAPKKEAKVEDKASPKAKEVKEVKASKKEDKKPVEVKKPTVTEAKASALNVKLTPRKARYVIDSIRGKDVDEALGILANTGRDKASRIVSKVIASAKANAVNNFNMNEDKLYVASIMTSDSIKMERFLPRAKGSASSMVKRYANIYVTVKERN